MKAIYRRFKLLDKEKEKALLQLVEEKRLTPNDLSLILSTISINQTSSGTFKEKLTSLVGEKTANDVRNAIANNKPIIVTGPQGPTGKTTLTNLINENGGIAFEEFEALTVRLDRPIS